VNPVHQILACRFTADRLAYYGGKAAAVAEAMTTQQRDMQGGPVIQVDEVAEFYCESPRDEWDYDEHFPNCAPPFQRFTLQWTHPAEVVFRGERQVSQVPAHARWVAVVVKAFELTDAERRMYKQLYSGPRKDGIGRAKWLITLNPWASQAGRPTWFGATGMVLVDAEGRNVCHSLTALIRPEMASTIMDVSAGYFFHIPCLALSFMHCRNVELRDTTDAQSPGDKALRRMRLPKLTFKTLPIFPMREVLRTEGRSDEVGFQRALHICRGHFSHYPDGLFNRTPGKPETVWVPQHVRGKAENGIVLKDYAVKPR
jgi:hypothetical protein